MEIFTLSLRPARILPVLAFLSTLFISIISIPNFPILGGVVLLLGLRQSLYLFPRDQKIKRSDDRTELSYGDVNETVLDGDIEWIYEDPSLIVIRCKAPLSLRINFGAMTIKDKEIAIRTSYIRHSSEIKALIRSVPAHRRQGLWRQFFYYVNPF